MRISSRDSGSRDSRDSRSGSHSHGGCGCESDSRSRDRDSYSRDSHDSYSRDSYSRDSGSRSRDSYSRDSGSRYPTDDDGGAGGTVYKVWFCPHCHPGREDLDVSVRMTPPGYSGPPPRGIEGFLRRNGGGNDSHSRDRTSSRTSHGSSARRIESGSSSTSRRDSSSSSSSRRDSGARPSSRPSAAGGELTLYGERSSASRHPSMDERSGARYSDDRSSTRHSARESSRRH